MVAKAQIAAIVAVMQEYLNVPPGALRIDRIEPIAAIAAPQGIAPIPGSRPDGVGNAWQMAGRLELMGFGEGGR
jgi:hypothetical protein